MSLIQKNLARICVGVYQLAAANRFTSSCRNVYFSDQPLFSRRFIRRIGGSSAVGHEDDNNVSKSSPFVFFTRYISEIEGNEDQFVTCHPGILKSGGKFSFDTLSFLPCYSHGERYSYDPIEVAASYKDLLLCCLSPDHTLRDNTISPTIYYLCNPITREYVELPPAPPSDTNYSSVNLVLDTTTAANSDKAGSRCEATGTIVRIPLCHPLRPLLKIDIFSFETNKWSESYVPVPRGIECSKLQYIILCQSVLCDKTLYWFHESFGIFALDIFGVPGADKCRLIDLPKDYDTARLYKCDLCNENLLGVWNDGKMRLCQLGDERTSFPYLKVWEANIDRNNGEKWILIHEMDFNSMNEESRQVITSNNKDEYYYLIYTPSVVGFDSENSDIIYMIYGGAFSVISYSISRGTVELIANGDGDMDFEYFQEIQLMLRLPASGPTPVPTLLRDQD